MRIGSSFQPSNVPQTKEIATEAPGDDGPRPGMQVGVPFVGEMPDEARGCPRCEGLVVMVAVACSQCGEIHQSGHRAGHAGHAGHGGAASSSWRRSGPVWDVPAVIPEIPTTTEPASAVLPVPVCGSDATHRSLPPRMRMSATYTNGRVRNPSTPKALPRGSPAPTPPPPPPRAAPGPPRATPREPRSPRRPLVQLIQEVLNRSATRDLEPGTVVVVRNRFNGRWTPGFAVHEVLEAGYRIRRAHTMAVLPTIFVRSDIAADKSGGGVGAKLHGRAAACAVI